MHNILETGRLGLGESPEAPLEELMDKWRQFNLAKDEDELAKTARIMEEVANYMLLEMTNTGIFESIAFPFIIRISRETDLTGFTGRDLVDQLLTHYNAIRTAIPIGYNDDEILDFLVSYTARNLVPRKRTFKVNLEMVTSVDNPNEKQAFEMLKNAYQTAQAMGMRVVCATWGWEK